MIVFVYEMTQMPSTSRLLVLVPAKQAFSYFTTAFLRCLPRSHPWCGYCDFSSKRQIFPTADIGIEHGITLALDGDEYEAPLAVGFMGSSHQCSFFQAPEKTNAVILPSMPLPTTEKLIYSWFRWSRCFTIQEAERFNEDALRMAWFRFRQSGFELEPEPLKPWRPWCHFVPL